MTATDMIAERPNTAKIEHFDVLAEHLAYGSPPPLQASLLQTPVQFNLLVVVAEILGDVHPLDQRPITETCDVHRHSPATV